MISSIVIYIYNYIKNVFLIFLLFRAIASSAPIWQFTGMTPCNDFYKVTSSVYRNINAECAKTISASWKAIDNVTESSKVYINIFGVD